jgi:exocyst complex component 3
MWFQIANINNCHTFCTLVNRMKDTHFSDEKASESNRFRLLGESFNTFAYEAYVLQYCCLCIYWWIHCSIEFLIEEVTTDLDQHIQDLMTRKWWVAASSCFICGCISLQRLMTSVCVDTICITIEDYCQDFVHLKDKFYETLLQKLQLRVANECYKSLFSKLDFIYIVFVIKTSYF